MWMNDQRFYNLNSCNHEMANELALQNNKFMSHSGMENKLSKSLIILWQDITYSCVYQKQHPWLVQLLSIHTVHEFFTNLAIVMVKNYFRPDRIYKMGENVLQPGP